MNGALHIQIAIDTLAPYMDQAQRLQISAKSNVVELTGDYMGQQSYSYTCIKQWKLNTRYIP